MCECPGLTGWRNVFHLKEFLLFLTLVITCNQLTGNAGGDLQGILFIILVPPRTGKIYTRPNI